MHRRVDRHSCLLVGLRAASCLHHCSKIGPRLESARTGASGFTAATARLTLVSRAGGNTSGATQTSCKRGCTTGRRCRLQARCGVARVRAGMPGKSTSFFVLLPCPRLSLLLFPPPSMTAARTSEQLQCAHVHQRRMQRIMATEAPSLCHGIPLHPTPSRGGPPSRPSPRPSHCILLHFSGTLTPSLSLCVRACTANTDGDESIGESSGPHGPHRQRIRQKSFVSRALGLQKSRKRRFTRISVPSSSCQCFVSPKPCKASRGLTGPRVDRTGRRYLLCRSYA